MPFAQPEPDKLTKAEIVLASIRDEWLKRPGVTAIDLGFKWSHGQMTDEIAIRVHLNQKRPRSQLSNAELFPRQIQGIPVDIIEARYDIEEVDIEEPVTTEAAAFGYDQIYTEIPLGVSVGNRFVTAGTLGAKVIDQTTNEEMILSNWHVLAASDIPEIGEAIWQPGKLDGGNSLNRIAALSRWVIGPFDAAVARLTGERTVLTRTVEGDVIEEATPVRLGMNVWKSGRTTGRTAGFVDGVQMTTSINYRQVGPRQLTHVFRIVPPPGSNPDVEISLGGDSGSVWVDAASGKAVGLHFAGEAANDPNERALAHDITVVADALNFRFPNPPPPAPPEVPGPTATTEPTGTVGPMPTTFIQRLIDWLLSLFGLK